MIGFAIGRILLVEAALLLLPMAVALGYGESPVPYLLPAALLVLCGGLLSFKKPRQASLFARDGLAVVALAWIAVSLFGALPFYISGSIESFVDCFFETVSGFTTTGATILTEVESLNRGILFWRSFTHWVGGMGVLVFVMAILPMGGDGHGMHMLRAEMPGPAVGKLVSRMSDTAKILYGIYLVMTVIEIVLLLAGGMPLFDACIHSFGSAGTGGFSSRNLSVGAYNNPYFEIVIGIFMLLFGINFNLYYFLLVRRFRDVFRSEELWAYVLIVATAVAAITLDIVHMYESVGTSLRHAFFPGVLHHHHHRLCHGGFQHLAHLFKGHSGGADVYRRLRRFHRWRHQGGPGGDPAEGVCQRDAADAPPQCGARHPVRGQAPERAEHPGRPSVSGGVPDGLRGVLPVGVSGAVGPGDHVHSGGCLHQQRGARSGDCRSHG